MKNTRKVLLTAIGILGIIPTIAWAYPNLEITSLWKKGVSNAIHPLNTADELGSSAIRISKGWFTDFDVTNITASSVTISGAVTGNLLPDGNNTRDIGSGALSWKDIYASGTARLASISSTNSTSTYFAVTNVNSALTPLANNTYDVGSGTLSWKNVYASGTLLIGDGSGAAPSIAFGSDGDTGIYRSAANTMVFARGGNPGFQVGPAFNYSYVSLYPADNNVEDLGAYGAAWRSIYASGTYYGGGFYASSGQSVMPTYSWSSDPDTGWYHSVTDGQTVLMINGSQEWVLDATAFNVSEHLIAPNNTHDLGIFGNAWRNINASGTARLGVIAVGGGTKAAPAINFDGSTDSGIYSPAAQDVRIERAGTTDIAIFNANGVQLNDHTFPGGNNVYNLGKYGAAWKGVYASSTSYLNEINAATTTFTGVVNIQPATGMTTSTVRVGSSTLRGCLAIGDNDGAGVTWCTSLNGVLSCSDANSCE